MSQTVIGFFDERSEAMEAVEKLVDRGVPREQIDISGSTMGDTYNTGSTYDTDTNRNRSSDDDDGDNAITRFFKNLFGGDDDDTNKYSRVAERADTILTVHCTSRDEAEDVADILDDCGAIDVDKKAQEYGYGSRGTTSGAYNNEESDFDRGDTGSDKIDVVREDIEIGKREVETGGVRLRSRIVEVPVEETIRLREERVVVNRKPVDRNVSDTDLANLQDQDIEMVERAEVPVVTKNRKVVEEVSLDKEVNEREETVRDTVRNTEVDVENNTRNRKNG